jgi:hypothetical protein
MPNPSIPPTYKLSDWQRWLYTHRCDIWKPVFGEGVNPNPTSYELQATDVPCRFYMHSGADVIVLGALIDSSSNASPDTVHFHEDQQIDSRWIIINKTKQPDGSNSLDYGRPWEANGDPSRIDSSPDMGLAHSVVSVNRLPRPPKTVTVE